MLRIKYKHACIGITEDDPNEKINYRSVDFIFNTKFLIKTHLYKYIPTSDGIYLYGLRLITSDHNINLKFESQKIRDSFYDGLIHVLSVIGGGFCDADNEIMRL